MVITLYRPWEKKHSHVGWRPRLLLEEKNLRYETRLVVMSQEEHKSEEILRLNPRGELPILQDVDAVVHEENAILMYINTFYTDSPLMPPLSDRKQYAQALVLFGEATGVWLQIVRPLLAYLMLPEDAIDMEKVKGFKTLLSREMMRWEKLLEYGSSGDFLLGSEISLCDICFFPYLAHLVRYGLPLEPTCPRLHKYYNMMLQRPSVKKTWPIGWADEPVAAWLA